MPQLRAARGASIGAPAEGVQPSRSPPGRDLTAREILCRWCTRLRCLLRSTKYTKLAERVPLKSPSHCFRIAGIPGGKGQVASSGCLLIMKTLLWALHSGSPGSSLGSSISFKGLEVGSFHMAGSPSSLVVLCSVVCVFERYLLVRQGASRQMGCTGTRGTEQGKTMGPDRASLVAGVPETQPLTASVPVMTTCPSPPWGLIAPSFPAATELKLGFPMNEPHAAPSAPPPTTVWGSGSGSKAHVHKPQCGPNVYVVGLRHRGASAGGVAAGACGIFSRARSQRRRAVAAATIASHRRPTSSGRRCGDPAPCREQTTLRGRPSPGPAGDALRSLNHTLAGPLRPPHLPLPSAGVCPGASLMKHPAHVHTHRTHGHTHGHTEAHTYTH